MIPLYLNLMEKVRKTPITIAKLAEMTMREFSQMRKEFATKDDFKRFATKDDLKRFATKDDLKRFATKDDLKYFATKEDLKQLKEDILNEVRSDNTRTMKSNDEVIKRLDILLKDHAAHTSLHKRITDDLHGHDLRIKRIEAVVN